MEEACHCDHARRWSCRKTSYLLAGLQVTAVALCAMPCQAWDRKTFFNAFGQMEGRQGCSPKVSINKSTRIADLTITNRNNNDDDGCGDEIMDEPSSEIEELPTRWRRLVDPAPSSGTYIRPGPSWSHPWRSSTDLWTQFQLDFRNLLQHHQQTSVLGLVNPAAPGPLDLDFCSRALLTLPFLTLRCLQHHLRRPFLSSVTSEMIPSRALSHPEGLVQSMRLCLQLLLWPLHHHQLHHLPWTPSLPPFINQQLTKTSGPTESKWHKRSPCHYGFGPKPAKQPHGPGPYSDNAGFGLAAINIQDMDSTQLLPGWTFDDGYLVM